jgi:hypothetical protein
MFEDKSEYMLTALVLKRQIHSKGPEITQELFELMQIAI